MLHAEKLLGNGLPGNEAKLALGLIAMMNLNDKIASKESPSMSHQ